MMVFDLDPGPPATIVECCQVALMLRDRCSPTSGSELYPKTSGSKGLQVYVPLNTPSATFDDTKPFALAVARAARAAASRPRRLEHATELREGRVLVDWSQNDDMKTTICVYSLRARPRPTVSTPRHLGRGRGDGRRRRPRALVFEWPAGAERVEPHGDLFEPVLKRDQQLPALSAQI